jgi:hypothetical protein
MNAPPDILVPNRRYARRTRLFVTLIAMGALVFSIAVAATAVSLGARAEINHKSN